MISRVLIANRGEIAVRIARGCAAYGVTSIAVYADPDADALHVRSADEAYALPGARPADTYLNIAALIEVARKAHADAVHPGYGFLSENADFAEAVIDAGMTWIGPSPRTISDLGDKLMARRLAIEAGVPLVQGTEGPVSSGEEALAFAQEHGLPIAIKAAFGGGGRGMKVAWRLDEVIDRYDSAVRESIAAFGRQECFVEQFLHRPRHVEVQVIADNDHHVVVLGTRDCSLQRRNQKVVEEAPAPFLTDEQRHSVERGAAAVCEAAGYVSAGTVEFLIGTTGVVSFLEVNTRLQVEHPITEMTSGVDIVRQQLRVADGLPLEITETPQPSGHAFEFRINAEDAGRGFLPSPGRITRFDAPSGPGIRLESGVVAGSTISALYDSLMAKLVVWGPDRDEALRRARQALKEFCIEGVPTLLDFDRQIVTDPAFVATGPDDFAVHTTWIETECAWLDDLVRPLGEFPGLAFDGAGEDASQALARSWIEIDGRRLPIGFPSALAAKLAGPLIGSGARLSADPAPGDSEASAVESAEASAQGHPSVPAPITGTIVVWKADDGAQVHEGDVIAVMEAMKMETPVTAPVTGMLKILVPAGGSPCRAGAAIASIG
ncbi:biotin carboxylase N-terminal domain-containing protein [Propionibacterium sp.]|uniref:acetyl/propionyl/methylcrotonyl-CoA carboxylase subunit alpha n=1 Tax=Propionibacterium sp. TaxID=1977903 RepID=UPI0039EAB208